MVQTATKPRRRRYTRRDYQAFLYIAPWLLGFVVLQLYPFIMSLLYSFCNYSLGSSVKFIGLDNYVRLFTRDADFVKSLKDTKVVKYYKDEFLMIATGLVLLGAIQVIGMLPALAIFVVLWLKIMEKAPWKDVIIILAIVMAIVIGVFVLWLKVRFPAGIIFDMLL